MKYTKFGKTGIEVSKMCLGTWGIGGAGWTTIQMRAVWMQSKQL